MILAVCSVGAGFLNAPLIGMSPYFEHFLGSTVEWREAAGLELNIKSVKWILAGASILIAAAGVGLAFNIFNKASVPAPKGILGWLAGKAHQLWGVDAVYHSEIVQPGANLSYWLWRNMDVRVIDGTVNGTGSLITRIANEFRNWQSGYVRNYALSMLIGVVLVVVGSLIALKAGLR
jgi:NADH-quinone oxidoreductase subunit L